MLDRRQATLIIELEKVAALFDGENPEAFRQGFETVDQIVAEGFQENFYNTIDDRDSFWAPRKDNLPHPLLIKTGKMFNAATNVTDPGHVFRVEGTVAEFGVSDDAVPYAKYHDRGTRRMPARVFAYANDYTQQRAFDAFIDVMDRHVEGEP